MQARIGKTTALWCAALTLAGCSGPATNDTADENANLSENERFIRDAEPCRYVVPEASFASAEGAQKAANPNYVERERNILVVEGRDSYRWNDAPVDPTILRQYLDIIGTMAPEPWVLVRRAPAADDASLAGARELIFRSMSCRADL